MSVRAFSVFQKARQLSRLARLCRQSNRAAICSWNSGYNNVLNPTSKFESHKVT